MDERYRRFVEGFSRLDRVGGSLEQRVYCPTEGVWVETGQVDFGVIRFRRARWWRRLWRRLVLVVSARRLG